MAGMKADHERLLNEAKEQRSQMLKEAKDIKDQIIAEARDQAKVEYSKIIDSARGEIENQKMAAITEVKNIIGTNAIDLAKKVLARELDTPPNTKATWPMKSKKCA